MSDNHLTVLIVEPGKLPYPRQIPDTLQAMQEIVGGDIDATYPYEDPVALVLNSSGKFTGLQPNRLLRLENGDPYDVVCGTFFLAGLGGETFVSLTPEQLRKYESLYSREMLFCHSGPPGQAVRHHSGYCAGLLPGTRPQRPRRL